MRSVLCFGELLLHLSPDAEGRWLTDNQIKVFAGGAEANVAAALAKWDVPVKYCTAIPANYLTSQIVRHLSDKNIDVSKILYQGDQVGLYYLPSAADLKNHSVIYDRKNSSFAQIQKQAINWELILEGIEWFHFSAISPAISDQLA